MRELLGSDVEKHVLAAGILLGQALGEVAHRRGELPVGAAELLQHESAQSRVGLGDPNGILKLLVVHEHGGGLRVGM